MWIDPNSSFKCPQRVSKLAAACDTECYKDVVRNERLQVQIFNYLPSYILLSLFCTCGWKFYIIIGSSYKIFGELASLLKNRHSRTIHIVTQVELEWTKTDYVYTILTLISKIQLSKSQRQSTIYAAMLIPTKSECISPNCQFYLAGGSPYHQKVLKTNIFDGRLNPSDGIPTLWGWGCIFNLHPSAVRICKQRNK